MEDKCNSYYIKLRAKKCKRKAFRKRLILILIGIVLISYAVIYYFSRVVDPVILSYGEQNVSRIVSLSCNDAISQASSQISYDDLITISYNTDGSISYIKADAENINKISNMLAHLTQNCLDNYSKFGYQIPLGTLSGIGILSGKGSLINFSINPIGSVICKFNTSFSQAGINQTLHKICVCIESDISLILPFQTKVIKKSAEFLLSECVIVGKIPSTYFNISNLETLT